MPKSSSVQFMLSAGGRVLLYTHRANQVHTMLHRFILEACKVNLNMRVLWPVCGVSRFRFNFKNKYSLPFECFPPAGRQGVCPRRAGPRQPRPVAAQLPEG